VKNAGWWEQGVMKQDKGISALSSHTQVLSAWEPKQELLKLHVQPEDNVKVAMVDMVGQLAQPE